MNIFQRIARWFRPKSQVADVTRRLDAGYVRFMSELNKTQHTISEMASELRKDKKNEHH